MYVFSAPADGKVRAGVSLGNLYLAQGRYGEAESAFATALKEAEAGFGKKGDYTVVALAPLALAEYRLGKLKEFEAHSDRVYQLVSKKPGFRLIALEPFWQKLEMNVQQGNLEEANGTAKKIAGLAAAQNAETKWLGERAVSMIATNEPMDWNRARQIHEIISKAGTAQFGAEPMKVAQMQFQFVNFGVEREHYDFAVAALEQVTRAQEKSPNPTLQLGVCGKMAEIRLAEKKPAEALPYMHRSVELLRAKYGEDARTAGAMDQEASLLKTLGREQESEELTARANEIRKKSLVR